MESAKSAKASLPAGVASQVVAFDYPACAGAPASPMWEGFAGGLDPEAAAQSSAANTSLLAEFDRKVAEEAHKAFEAGRERGRLEGRQAEHEALAGLEQQRRRQSAELVESFAQERDRYLLLVEREVVELALAVAARILRREAQMDPLLLTGAVRVALGQLSASTNVTLHVPPAELDLWSEAIALLPNLAVKPAIVAGEGMRLGDCAIETGLGSVDLGIRSQLGEIERGFFDRAGNVGGRFAGAAATAAQVKISGSPV